MSLQDLTDAVDGTPEGVERLKGAVVQEVQELLTEAEAVTARLTAIRRQLELLQVRAQEVGCSGELGQRIGDAVASLQRDLAQGVVSTPEE